MNILEIVNDKLIENIDDSINISVIENTNFFSVKKIIIKILKDTMLNLIIKNDNEKYNIEFEVSDVNFKLFEIKKSNYVKTQCIYNISNSDVYVYKFNDIGLGKERSIINLSNKAKIKYNFRTICKDNEEYDFIINHVDSNTISDVNLNGVNIKKGLLSLNVTGEVGHDKKDCILNQDSRIINLTENACMIKPNLLIDEYSTSASHSAHIGNFNFDELFYLQSRGISKDVATKLLIKGFLLYNNVFESEKIIEIIDKYWR